MIKYLKRSLHYNQIVSQKSRSNCICSNFRHLRFSLARAIPPLLSIREKGVINLYVSLCDWPTFFQGQKLNFMIFKFTLWIRDENLPGPARPRPNGPAQPGPGRAGPGRRWKSGVRPTGPKIFLEVNFLTLISICLLFTVKTFKTYFFEKHKARMTSWDINIRYYISFQLHPRVWWNGSAFWWS